MVFSNLPLMAALATTISFATALPKASQNWELVTNELGYTVPRFRSGMEPGSDDFVFRHGDLSAAALNESSILNARDTTRSTSPYTGETKMPFGCNMDIANTIFSHLSDLCGEDRCDGGTGVTTDVFYPYNGKRAPAEVSLSVSGHYPRGQKENMIRAFQAMVPQNGVDYEMVKSSSPLIGGNFGANTYYECEVVSSSNFFDVVVRDGDNLVAQVEVKLAFTNKADGFICETVGNVGKEIAGAINGIAGGFFGVVQAAGCANRG